MSGSMKARAWGVAFLLTAAAGATLLAAAPSLAQSAAGCSARGSDEERIACLEERIEALEQALNDREMIGSETVEASPPPAPAADGPSTFGAEQIGPPVASGAEIAAPVASAASAAAEPAGRERRRWLRMPNVPFFGDDDADDGAAPTAVAAAPSSPAAPSTVDPSSFGAEQVAERNNTRNMNARDEDSEVLRASIVDFQELHRGRLVVALDNGQMWRQLDVDSRKISLDEGETYPVEIWRSGFGGYRMKVDDNIRIMSVERMR